MTQAFLQWYNKLMPWEGTIRDWERIPDNQYDRGGLTNGGVTIGTWNTVAPRYGWTPGEAGLRAMTKAQHKQIAYDWYWVPSGAPGLPPAVAIYHADTAWGSGVGNAGFLLQHALRALGQPVRLDGGVGRETLGAAKRVDTTRLLAEYHRQRAAFLARIIANDASQARFAQGWTNRINDIYNTAAQFLQKKNG